VTSVSETETMPRDSRSTPGRLPFRLLERYPTTLVAALVCALVGAGWWHSSRYSERHLVYLGDRTVEAFSASSLLRLSLVHGRVGEFGARTYYRQPNARGRFTCRPFLPRFRVQPQVWEMTLGYWHLAALAVAGLIGAAALEGRWRIGDSSDE